ncbi:MAG TPA: hypothetical protein VMZ71_05260 [Gemmataceae bacterium]|nr:hypothetical protein [Gemmataceae bacterium]
MAGGYQSSQGNPSLINMGTAMSGLDAAGRPGVTAYNVESADIAALKLQQQFQKEMFDRTNPQNLAAANADRAAQLQIGMAPWAYKDKVFGTISPLLQQLTGGQNPGGLVGGQNPATPQVDASPIWNPQQINQQVNSAKANNAQAADTQSKAAQAKTAAQGFGSKSPLLAALEGGIGQARMGADADAERGIRWDAAAGNAGHVMKGQAANQNAAVAFNGQDIERRKANNQYTTSLLSVLGGMV